MDQTIVIDILREVAEAVCDDICKYAAERRSDEEFDALLEEHCREEEMRREISNREIVIFTVKLAAGFAVTVAMLWIPMMIGHAAGLS